MKALMEEGLPVTAGAVNQQVSFEASAKIGIMLMVSIGTPFDMLLPVSPRIVVFAASALVFLWWSWSFWSELAELIAGVWISRPETIVGGAMIIIPILLAGPLNYLLNVRRTTGGGVIRVNGMASYIAHGMANVVVQYAFIGSILAGIFILLFGWDIR